FQALTPNGRLILRTICIQMFDGIPGQPDKKSDTDNTQDRIQPELNLKPLMVRLELFKRCLPGIEKG
ncbi:MAG: hypothetical protein AB2736_03525, partial [Candidatus Thiodiazotropha taylori]